MATRPPFTRFGRYLLLHRLAVGGMAEVHLAIDPQAVGDRQLVVIKQIREDLCQSREFVDMFIDEVRVIDRLDHPGIAHMHEYGVVDGRSFIVLEHVWGESLATLTRICADQQTRFPISAALYIAAEVAAALDHAHTHRDRAGRASPVIHRDVTLSNVVVSYQGEVKILDFGIAKAQGRLAETRAGHVKGTLGYLAPEQIRGEPVGPHTDIYQLGVMLYHLVVGRPPLSEVNELKLMKAIVDGRIAPPRELNPELPSAVEQVLLRALAARAEARFRSAGAMAEVLRRLIAPVLHEAPARMASLLRRITGDRYQRQQAFIRDLIDGSKAVEVGGSSLFEWAFSEASLDTSTHELAVETDHASLGQEATAVVPRPALDDAQDGRLQVDPPDTFIDDEAAEVPAGVDFAPGRLVDEQTEDGAERGRPLPPRALPAGNEVPDLHDIQTVLELPPARGPVPRPVSGIFRSLTADAEREVADPGDEARGQALALERALGREEPALADDEVVAELRAALGETPDAPASLEPDSIHDQITNPGLGEYEATVVVRERRAAARAFGRARSGPVAIEDAQTRLLPLDDAVARPAAVTTSPAPRDSALPPPASGAERLPAVEVDAVTALLDVANEADAGEVPAPALPPSRTPTAPSLRQVAAPIHDEDFAAADWQTDASIAVGRFRNRGARFLAGILLVALLGLVGGAFLLDPSISRVLTRALARLGGELDAGAAGTVASLPGDAAPGEDPRARLLDRAAPAVAPAAVRDASGRDARPASLATAPPRPSRVDEEDGDDEAPPPLRVLGLLRVEAEPAARILHAGIAARGRATLELRARRGSLRVEVDGARIELQHEVVERQIKFHVHSVPPLDLDYNGRQVGQTPKAMVLGDRFELSLDDGARERPVRIRLRFEPR